MTESANQGGVATGVQPKAPFHLIDATVAEVYAAYAAGTLTARQLVEAYLRRIEAYDLGGPRINSIITVCSDALEQADRLDAAYRSSGAVGVLHGIPVILKDQIDAAGTPTTLGSVMFKDYYPDRDAFVVERLRAAGAIILAKATLGEMGGGDTHGSLFGSTRNPFDPARTVGGSSGGPAASVSANFATLAVGQEAFASIRRPAAWNGIAGMRPTPGLVSRSGVYAGWPGTVASLGPMTRSVEDLTRLLDVLAGYDPEDPMTALGVDKKPETYTVYLDAAGLRGARIGVIRESIGSESEPDSDDFKKVSAVFDRAVSDLQAAGATVIDPVVIPRLQPLLAKRGAPPSGGPEDAWDVYYGRSKNPPYRSRQEMTQSPEYGKVYRRDREISRGGSGPGASSALDSIQAREELMFNIMKVMADHRLDAIVHKTVEHQPTKIEGAVEPPFIRVDLKGVPALNTFLVYASSMTVPAGLTSDGLPAGITFFGRPYAEPTLIRLAYAYEQATRHRVPPPTTPKLEGEP